MEFIKRFFSFLVILFAIIQSARSKSYYEQSVNDFMSEHLSGMNLMNLNTIKLKIKMKNDRFFRYKIL